MTVVMRVREGLILGCLLLAGSPALAQPFTVTPVATIPGMSLTHTGSLLLNALTVTGGAPSTLPPEPPGARDPGVQPYSSFSLWNTAIGSGAQWSAAADPDTIDLRTPGGGINAGSWSIPIYQPAPTDAPVKFTATDPTYPLAGPRLLDDAAADFLQAADNGVKCDGVTDIGPALQTLLNRVSASTSPDIWLPYGTCLINTPVTVKAAPVHLHGHSWSEATSTGTTLYTTNTAITPISINPSVPNGFERTNGSSIDGVALAQQQPLPLSQSGTTTSGSSQVIVATSVPVGSAIVGSGIPTEAFVTGVSGSGPYTLSLNVAATASATISIATWAPTVYPPFIYARDTASLKLRDIYGFGVYDGISLYDVGRDEVTNVYGQFFHSVFTTDAGYDLAHVNDWHIWPFWESANALYSGPLVDAVTAWQQANMNAVVLGRQDGATIHDVFVFAANGGVAFRNLSGAGPATNIMIDQMQCDSVVHCLSNSGQPGASVYLGSLNSFGQRGISSATPYPGANAIYADANSCFNVAGGDIKQGFPDTNVVELDATTCISSVYLNSVQAYLMAGATGSSIFKLGYTAPGNAPHSVNVNSPLNISLRSGSYTAGVNWATTNAVVRIPGLDYQILETAAASAFDGNTYGIENARPRMFIEADDGNTISSLTIRLPMYPYDGEEVSVTTYVPISSLSLTDPNGWPVVGNVTSLAAGATARFKYTNTGTKIVWFKQ